MSTYCGERYLSQQIESIFSQDDVDVYLVIRDDGSSDRTQEILQEKQACYPDRLFWYTGENMGVGGSFMDCLYAAVEKHSDADYFALADQDDYWLEQKLARGIQTLEQMPVGLKMYTSNQIVSDESLNRQGLRFRKAPDYGYGQILRGNMLSGCTFIMNTSFAQFVSREENRPSAELLRIRIHDVWLIEIASLFGTIYYDENSYILYRQHSNNVVGALERNSFAMLRRKLYYLFSSGVSDGSILMARELLRMFGERLGDKYQPLKSYSMYIHNWKAKIAIIHLEDTFRKSGESHSKYILRALSNKL